MVGKTDQSAYDVWQAGIEYADYYSGMKRRKGTTEAEQRFKQAMPGGTGYRLKLDLYKRLVDDSDLGIADRIKAIVKSN